MKKLLFIATLLSMGHAVHAQYSYFNNIYETENVGTNNKPVWISEDNQFKVIGISSQTLIDSGVSFLEIANDGNLFADGYTGNNEFGGIGVANPSNQIVQINDSTWIGVNIVGASSDFLPHVYSINAQYELLWDHVIEDLANDSSIGYYAGGIVKKNESEVLVITTIQDGSGPGASLDSVGYCFSTISIDGLVMSHSFFWPDDEITGVFGVDKTETGYIIWGQARGNTLDPLGCSGDVDVFVRTLNEEGETLAYHQFEDGDAYGESGIAMQALPDNKAIAAFGYVYDFECEYYKTLSKPKVVMFSTSSLDTLWQKVYDLPELSAYWNFPLLAQDIIEGTDGGYLVTFTNTDFVEGVGLYGDALLLKIDDEGELEWYRFVQAPTESVSVPMVLTQATDGGYAMAGYTYDPGSPYWVIKFDACGDLVFNGCPTATDSHSEHVSKSLFTVWPNPFHNTLTAKIPENATSVSFMDAIGRIVFEENVFYPKQEWNLSMLSDGVYVINVVMESGEKISQRIVKQ